MRVRLLRSKPRAASQPEQNLSLAMFETRNFKVRSSNSPRFAIESRQKSIKGVFDYYAIHQCDNSRVQPFRLHDCPHLAAKLDSLVGAPPLSSCLDTEEERDDCDAKLSKIAFIKGCTRLFLNVTRTRDCPAGSVYSSLSCEERTVETAEETNQLGRPAKAAKCIAVLTTRRDL